MMTQGSYRSKIDFNRPEMAETYTHTHTAEEPENGEYRQMSGLNKARC